MPLRPSISKFRDIAEVNRARLRLGKPVREQPVWLAAGPNFAKQTADRLAAALDAMTQDGTVERIIMRYRF